MNHWRWLWLVPFLAGTAACLFLTERYADSTFAAIVATLFWVWWLARTVERVARVANDAMKEEPLYPLVNWDVEGRSSAALLASVAIFLTAVATSGVWLAWL